MIYELLAIKVLPQLKVSIRIASDTYTPVVYEFDLTSGIMEWIGLGHVERVET